MRILKLALLLAAVFLLPACERAVPPAADPDPAGDAAPQLTGFAYRHESGSGRLRLTGVAAVHAADGETTVARPDAVIETGGGQAVHIRTAADGQAELALGAGGGLTEIILRRGVELELHNRVTGQVEMTARAEKMHYFQEREEIIMTGDPVVNQGRNEFRGGTIRYLLSANRIFIEDGASGLLRDTGQLRRPEEPAAAQ